jgi:hypothetical protein
MKLWAITLWLLAIGATAHAQSIWQPEAGYK